MSELIEEIIKTRQSYRNFGFKVVDAETKAECLRMSEDELQNWLAEMKRELAAQ